MNRELKLPAHARFSDRGGRRSARTINRASVDTPMIRSPHLTQNMRLVETIKGERCSVEVIAETDGTFIVGAGSSAGTTGPPSSIVQGRSVKERLDFIEGN